MKKEYVTPTVEVYPCTPPLSLCNTLSVEGNVDEWTQEDTEMEDFTY
ncbi:MAG: hypothetical protein MR396_02200 [Phocaeicola sp.]|nr:hypothetical protein [Phocaeicola sp.]